MSPEEFDNRLKSAFQDEYLPPKEQLWANISSQLEPKAKTPFWYWLLPAIIVATVAIVWVGNQNHQKQETAIETVIDPSTLYKPNTKNNEVISSNEAKPFSTNEDKASVKQTSSVIVDPSSNKTETIRTSAKPLKEKTRVKNHKKIDAKTENPLFVTNIKTNQSQSKTPNGFFHEDDVTGFGIKNHPLLNLIGFPSFLKRYELEQLYSINTGIKSTNSNKNTVPKRSPKTSDFSSKNWFTFGLGPQLAINSIRMNQDSQAWVHRHLWDNKDRLTSNGSGFQAFGHVALKFGKNQRFIFETGLNYSIRTEDIKLNESSYDIAARDNTGKINQYTQILLKVIYGTDTTEYLAVSNFSLAVNNKYHILTVPFRLSAEHKISEATYMSYGLGGGFSMLSSHNTEHLNMIWGNSVKERNSTQFSASLNANLSLYTNFNDLGQIGVYTGLQMYLNPWKVNSNQYAINMRDLQMGITFRKPF
jgi:hypothetical protein